MPNKEPLDEATFLARLGTLFETNRDEKDVVWLQMKRFQGRKAACLRKKPKLRDEAAKGVEPRPG
ncbi:unnamed protein product, partial [Prorocentrum cordatum]